jgi:hypothetical protein
MAAQQSGFIKPQILDSASAALREGYIATRDTLRAVSGKSALLQRDIRSSTDAMLLSRARNLEVLCTASLRQLDRSRVRLLDGEVARRAPAPRRTALDRSIIELRAALTTCASEYRSMSLPESAEAMRARGVNVALKNQVAVRSFENTAELYLLSVGIRVRPHGSGSNPYAGSARSPN